MTSGELVSATIAAVSGITFTLHKLGLLEFKITGRRQDKPLLQMEAAGCPFHSGMDTLTKSMKDIQTQNIEKHKNHESALKKGEQDFHEIRLEISELKVGVGILLDRTGGRPDGYGRRI